jgi:hypothetical protein
MACHEGKGWSLRLRYAEGDVVETYNAGSREGDPYHAQIAENRR